MQSMRRFLLTGCAVAAVWGLGQAAQAQQSPAVHVMTIQLPGGGIGQIQYTGNVPPQVYISDAPVATAAFAPMPSLFGADSPFAMMERISADMDRQMATMLQQTAALSAMPLNNPAVTEAALRNLPPGTSSYTFVSTLSGNGVCTRSVEMTSSGNGAAPRVVSHTSGDCGSQASGPMGVTTVPAPSVPAKRPHLLWTKNERAPAKAPDVLLTRNDASPVYTDVVQRTAAQR